MTTPMAAAGGTGTGPGHPDNLPVAELLREMASLLQSQGDEGWRARAYRHAAAMLEALPRSVREIDGLQGPAGLDALPTVGPGIAAAIDEIVRTGAWSRLDRLRGQSGPEALFKTVPGIGEQFAHRLHDELEIETLEGLEAAAHDGRLAALPGVGPRRAAAIRASVTHLLDRQRALQRARLGQPAPGPAPEGPEPGLEDLLAVDRQYREAAQAGRLPTLAPRRFNPEGRAWLPVLHVRRGDWHFTALYSNTARAHELGRVTDWVVIYAEDSDHHERQYTVVTPARGPLAGRRVVRGREQDCLRRYAGDPGAKPA